MCPGPDTAGVKTALLESALVGTATANVAITVLAVNDAPAARQSRRHDRCGRADRRAARSRRHRVGCRSRCARWRCRPVHRRDPRRLQRDGGGCHGGRVRLRHHGRAVHGRAATISQFGGATFATIVNARRHADHHVHQRRDAGDHRAGRTTCCATSPTPTPATRRRAGRPRLCASSTETPGPSRRSGGSESRIATTTVDIAPVDRPDHRRRRQRDHAAKIRPAFITVLDNDSDPDAPLVVRAINGTPIAVNETVMVANGKVSLSGDGTLVYEPSFGFHDKTSFTYQAGTGLHYQFFDRDVRGPTSTASRRSRPRVASAAPRRTSTSRRWH